MRTAEPGNRQLEVPRATPLGELTGERAQAAPPPVTLASDYCIEILHDLNNAFASVLMNAQVLDGKMPSYSRSKRYIHEIERSAQRGGALLKRLLERLPAGPSMEGGVELALAKVPPVAERTAVVASQGPTAAAKSAPQIAPSTAAYAAPDFSLGLAAAHRNV